MKLALLIAAAVATEPAAPAQPEAAPAAPQLVVAPPAAPNARPGSILLAKDTMVRLMVLNEVNSHQAKVGDRFVLRVDENVAVGRTVVIPVGAKAWAEITEIKENGALGHSGRIGARLLYIEAPAGRIPVSGDQQSKGNAGGDRVALAVVGFGLFGLLARGTQGKLKAGAIFNGYVQEDMVFDPEAKAVLPAASLAP